MESSYLMSKGKALEQFPMLKSDGLVGAVVYYDGMSDFYLAPSSFSPLSGQHNDSRMNLALILTAIKAGATATNYCGVTSLRKDPTTGLITGARVKDYIAGGEFDVKAKARSPILLQMTTNISTGNYQCHRPIHRLPPLSLHSHTQTHRARKLRRTHRPPFLLRPYRYGPSRPRNK
jgi:glycerol-3-phosphate dehydrogenase